MADRNSAEIFAKAFEACADESEAGKRIAAKLWPRRNKYDFTDGEMHVDKALIALGLARRGSDGIEYLQDDGTFE